MSAPLTITDFAYRARLVHPDRLAVIDDDSAPASLGRLTYAELFARVDGMISALNDLDVPAGARVAIVSPNSARFLIALFATTCSGRVFVPINFRLGSTEVAFIVDDAAADVLLIDVDLDAVLGAVSARHRIVLDGRADAELFAPSTEILWGDVAESAPATINYTSGTTSTPKGVVLTHRAHWLNAVTLGWQLGIDENDTYLHTLPQFHVNGWGLPLALAAMGAPNVVLRAVRGSDILRTIAAAGVTLLCGAAAVVATVTEAAESMRRAGETPPGVGRVRMVSGGSATPAAVIERFEAATGWEMIHAYGLTEAAPVLTVNQVRDPQARLTASQRADRLTLAGAPLFGVRLKISEDGEILARAAKTFERYWERPEATAESYKDGWLKTGDGGEMVDGLLRITDRKKDVIVSGGENVSSLEVESCLFQHPAVADVAVVGAPHPRWQETPVAHVVLRSGAAATEGELIAHCRSYLAGFKCPTRIVFVDLLPRTATGKVQKFVLRDRTEFD